MDGFSALEAAFFTAPWILISIEVSEPPEALFICLRSCSEPPLAPAPLILPNLLDIRMLGLVLIVTRPKVDSAGSIPSPFGNSSSIMSSGATNLSKSLGPVRAIRMQPVGAVIKTARIAMLTTSSALCFAFSSSVSDARVRTKGASAAYLQNKIIRELI